MGTRFVKLLKILIKIGIMMLVMTGLILVSKYISNANGSEKEGRKTSLERVVKPCFTICNQEENLPLYPLLNIMQKK
jgi:hypothetical protein|tara:strand:+ start:359 stop:589 length:231 start_codon:yes stop_codon:yes gene_type:complete